jgi:phospholipid/cholesterol/gamma-HCH transport system substrate-binding protein
MELIVGGSILVALFVLIAGVLWLKEVSIASKMVTYTVIFPNIGALQLGDPVSVNGVRMGDVGKIKLHGSKVAVTINLDKEVQLTDSSRITVQNVGLMGERVVGIQLSECGSVVKPNSSEHPPTYLYGYFDSGIAEAMGLVGTLVGQAQVLVEDISTILDATVGDTAFVTFFKTLVWRVDTVATLVDELVVTNKDGINSAVADLQSVAGELKTLVDENGDNVSTIISNGAQLTERALVLADEVGTMSGSLKNMLNAIENGEGSLGMLIEDERFYTDLKQTVAQLDTLVSDVQDNGLKLRVKLGFKAAK